MNNDDFFIGKTTTNSYIQEAHKGSLVLRHLVDVLNPTQNYVIKGVQFWRKQGDDTKLSKGATVLVWRADDFSAYIVNVLEDPSENIDPTKTSAVRPAKGPRTLYDDKFQPGEKYFQSTEGAYLYLSNGGDVIMGGSSAFEQIIISGSQEKVGIQGTEMEWSNVIDAVNAIVPIPAIGYLPSTTISRGYINSVDDVGIEVRTKLTKMLRGQLQVDSVGNVTAKSFIEGVTQAYLELMKTGQINLKNLVGSVTINPAGQINLNGGSKGVARVDDLVSIYTLLKTLLTTIKTHTHPTVGVSAELASAVIPDYAGQIAVGSLTVKAGG